MGGAGFGHSDFEKVSLRKQLAAVTAELAVAGVREVELTLRLEAAEDSVKGCAVRLSQRVQELRAVTAELAVVKLLLESQECAFEAVTAERNALRADVEAAAGNFLVPYPEVGSDLAKVMRVNKMLKYKRDAIAVQAARMAEWITEEVGAELPMAWEDAELETTVEVYRTALRYCLARQEYDDGVDRSHSRALDKCKDAWQAWQGASGLPLGCYND